MRRAAVGLVLAVVATLALAGCTEDGGVPGVGPSRIEVDTPALREQKADVGIEDCESGTGASDLPVLTLPCLGGGPSVDLSTLDGPLLINIWNSPCGPCQREMPVLQEFYETYGDRVPVLGIDITDTQPGDAIELARLTGAHYPQLADPGGELYDTGFDLRPAVPQFIVLGPDGRMVGTPMAGGVDTLDEVVAMVESKLGPL